MREDDLLALVDHIEIEHERELAGLSATEVLQRHAQMHQLRDDWGHDHTDYGKAD